MNVRIPLAVAAMILVTASACDRINRDQIVVSPQGNAQETQGSVDQVLADVRAMLTLASFTRSSDYSGAEHWRWRDPNNPPGLGVALQREEGQLTIELSQDLLGNIGRTEKYLLVKATLIDSLGGKYGKANVHVN